MGLSKETEQVLIMKLLGLGTTANDTESDFEVGKGYNIRLLGN